MRNLASSSTLVIFTSGLLLCCSGREPDSSPGAAAEVTGGSGGTAATGGSPSSTAAASWGSITAERIENVQAITVDAEGNVIVGGGFDGYIAKFKPRGTLIWSREVFDFDGGARHAPSLEAVLRLGSDGANNVYVLGSIRDGAFPGEESAATDEIYLAKYSPEGERLWADQFPLDTDRQIALHVDTAGRATIGGYASGAVPGLEGRVRAFAMRYDGEGNRLWVRAAGPIFLRPIGRRRVHGRLRANGGGGRARQRVCGGRQDISRRLFRDQIRRRRERTLDSDHRARRHRDAAHGGRDQPRER